MPEYEYKCDRCGFKVTKKFSYKEELLPPVCLRCGTKLTRIIKPATVIYKGSGFYNTDKEE